MDNENILTQLGVSPNAIQQFEVFFQRLVEYNSHTNITAIVDRQDVFVKHFADSILPQQRFLLNATILDMGCGAGFPSIPLAIVRPDLQFVLVDSVGKKIKFVEQIINELSLTNITTVHSRAEELKTKQINTKPYLQYFDYGIARAVAKMSTLAEYILPFVKIGGQMIAYKSQTIDDELQQANRAITLLGGQIQQNWSQTIPCTDITRHFIIIQKKSQTPLSYPRGQNKPRTNPL